MSEPRLSRAELTTARRLVEWMRPVEYDEVPDFDHPGYDRMAKAILDAMAGVGPAKSLAGVAVLIKALALVLNHSIQGLDDETLSETCRGVGKLVDDEVTALRRAVVNRRKTN